MKNNNPIVKSAEEYVFNLLRDHLQSGHVYHSYKHTWQTLKACRELAEPYNLSSRDTELLMLAALFHDTGYTRTYKGHEEAGVEILREYLGDQYPHDDLNKIEALILSTKGSVRPTGLLQEILHDADYISIGKKKFSERGDLLRIEWERLLDRRYTDLEWAQAQLDFLICSYFITDVAIREYGGQREENIRTQRQKVGEAAAEQEKLAFKLGKGEGGSSKVKDGRGIETLYRSVYEYHINLSSIADNKANIMISINTIIISLVITLFGSGYTFSGQNEFESLRFVIPMTVLLLTSLLAVVFAILSSRPNVTSKEKYELSKKESSILFFGNFVQLQLNEFVNRIKELKEEKEELYDSMSVDIYHLGAVLIKKYRLLSWSYNIFMGGLILCALGFVVIMMFSYDS